MSEATDRAPLVESPGNSVPKDVWAKVLSPLSLIGCIKLETVSKSFSENIYKGQHRFVWSKKFQDFLYRKYKISRTAEDADEFLLFVMSKIGPYCRQLIFKLHKLPSNHVEVFNQMKKMQSLYLKVLYFGDSSKNGEWSKLLASPNELIIFREAANVELRIVFVEEEMNLLADDFAKWLDTFKDLGSLQILPTTNNITKKILQLQKLRKYRLVLNITSIEFFPWLGISHPHLEQLYLKWEVYEITPKMVETFCKAMPHLKNLRILSLQIDWICFEFASPDDVNFTTNWKNLCKVLPATIKKLSIDVQHLNFRSFETNSTLMSTLTQHCKLEMLQIVASVKDVFPLKIKAQVNTLELVFTYAKLFRHIAQFLNEPNLIDNLVPIYNRPSYFVFDYGSCIDQYRNNVIPLVCTLKLKHCPILDYRLVNHLQLGFTSLEKLYFQAFHACTYTYTSVQKFGDRNVSLNFEKCLMLLVDNCPNLRVLKFGDKFWKPQLHELVLAFVRRARKNPHKQYALFIDKLHYCTNQNVLNQTIDGLNNLRVF